VGRLPSTPSRLTVVLERQSTGKSHEGDRSQTTRPLEELGITCDVLPKAPNQQRQRRKPKQTHEGQRTTENDTLRQ